MSQLNESYAELITLMKLHLLKDTPRTTMF